MSAVLKNYRRAWETPRNQEGAKTKSTIACHQFKAAWLIWKHEKWHSPKRSPTCGFSFDLCEASTWRRVTPGVPSRRRGRAMTFRSEGQQPLPGDRPTPADRLDHSWTPEKQPVKVWPALPVVATPSLIWNPSKGPVSLNRTRWDSFMFQVFRF